MNAMGSGNGTTRPLASRLAAGCAALALFAHAAAAQTEAPAPGEEQPRRYTVELIVFAYDEGVPSGSEVFVPDEPPEERIPEFSDRIDDPAFPDDAPRSYGDAGSAPFPAELPDGPLPAAGDAAGDPLEDLPPARQWIELRLHDEQQPRMNEIYAKLVNIDAYHPLMRASWTQTTHARDVAPALHLQSLGGAPPGLDGSVTLYAGRFVHLVLDLALDAAPAEAGVYRGDGRRADGYGDDLFRAPLRYRLAEDRIMRMGDIRYFDHPRFGVIARVTAAEDDEDEAEPEAVAGSD
jgi:hypothetical protein